MSQLTVSSSVLHQIFRINIPIPNDVNLTLSYHTGLIFPKTTFYKNNRAWIIVDKKGMVVLENKPWGRIVNTHKKVDCKVPIVQIFAGTDIFMSRDNDPSGKYGDMCFYKNETMLANVKNTRDGFVITFSDSNHVHAYLLLGLYTLNYMHVSCWE